MRTLKQIAGALLAGAMIFSLSSTAVSADEPSAGGYTITINTSGVQDGADYVFTAYQIFAGDSYTDPNTGVATLSNVEWGDGLSDAGIAAVLAAYADQNAATAEDVAALLTTAADAETLADIARDYLQNGHDSTYDSAYRYTISGLEAGYYVIVNTSVPDGAGAVYTSYIMQIAEDVTVTSKAIAAAPAVSKTMTEVDDSAGTQTQGVTVADFDFGDDISFNITAAFEDDVNYLKYEAYQLVFHDEMSDGLSFNNDVVVTVTIGSNTFTAASGYDVVKSGFSDDCTFEVRIADIFSLYDAQGQKIDLLGYDSEGAAAGLAADTIYICVDYTARYLETATARETNKAYISYSNDPNDPDGGDPGDPDGGSVEEESTVNSYSVTVNKVDGDGNALTGAGFTLYKYVADTGDYVEVDTIAADSSRTEFTFSGLDAGTYKLVESTTPDGYNTADDLIFIIYSDYDAAAGQTYEYVLTATDSGGSVISALSTAVGADDMTFKTAEGSSTLATAVVNNAGNAIPSAGGIGTTFLYIGGVCLLIAAAACVVILAVKKKKN